MMSTVMILISLAVPVLLGLATLRQTEDAPEGHGEDFLAAPASMKDLPL